MAPTNFIYGQEFEAVLRYICYLAAKKNNIDFHPCFNGTIIPADIMKRYAYEIAEEAKWYNNPLLFLLAILGGAALLYALAVFVLAVYDICIKRKKVAQEIENTKLPAAKEV